MAKKKSGYELWKEVQAQETQRKAEGRINFKEDSRATRVQYSLPHYQGRSEEKSYKWEKELLDPLKFKGVRSYNDKFKTWASQQGMTDGQAAEFRKYMDFQEDSVWEEPELNEDGTIKQNQSLNYARGAYIKGDEIDSILNNMTTNFQNNSARQAEVRNSMATRQEEAITQAKEQQTQRDGAVKEYKENDDRPAYAKFIDRFLLPISKGMSEVVAPGNNERMIQNDLMDGKLDNPVNQASLVDRGTETKILEGAGTIAGYVAPYGQGYKVADLALNKLPKLAGAVTNPYAQRAVKGAIAGTAAEGGLATTNELFNSEAKDMQDYALQIGLGAAGGAVLDPALYGVGQGIIKGAEKAAQGLVPDSVPFTPEGFQQGLEEAFGDPLRFGQTTKPQGRSAVPPVTNPTAQATVNPLDQFTTTDIPAVETPLALEDSLNFAQSGGRPQARGTSRIENPARYARENLGNMADTTLNRVNQLDGNRNQRVLEVMEQMKANRNLTPEQEEAFTQAQRVWEQRQVREDAFVEQELAPYYESQQVQADIEQQWGTTVKQAKEESQRIKQQFGKIHVPSGRGEDIVDQIPPQFRANKNELAYDVYKMADEMGMTPEELVQYLKQLDNDSKLRRKDLGQDDSLRIDENQWQELTNAARLKFAETEEGRAIDQLFTDSLEAGRPTDVDALYAANRGANDPATFDELIKLAEMETNSKPIEPDLKSLLRNDPKVNNQIQALNDLLGGARQSTATSPTPNVSSLDEMLSFLDETAATGISTQNPSELADEILKRFENVNNSQAVDNTLGNLNPSSKMLMNLDGTINTPKETSTPKVEDSKQSNDFLMRLNAQKFNDADSQTPKLFSDGEVGSEEAIDRFADKFYENYVNSTHSFKVAEEKVIANEIKRLEESGSAPKKVEQLKQQLKEVKKSGSAVEKAVSNELGAGVAAKESLKRHFKVFDSIVSSDAEMAEALTYQLARDLDWRRKHGFLDDEYTINEGVDWNHINEIINRGQDNEVFKQFNVAFRDLTQEWRDVMRQYNQIDDASYKALSENPYYMPLARDFSPEMNNVDRGMRGKGTATNRSSGPTILHTISGGDVKALFKNPIDTLVNNTFAVYKNAYKEETGRQLLRLAKMDKDGLFFHEVSGNATGGNIVRVSNGGKARYVRLQPDLIQVLKENEEYIKTDFLGKLTSAFASLKTRSLEYQSGAIVRDLGSGYVNSQITDPFRYTAEVMKAIKNKNASVKEIAGFFDKAYNDHTGGIDPDKILTEFKKQQGVTVVDAKDKSTWNKAVATISNIFDKATKPITALGQFVDEIPRDIEVRETERLFMKKHGQQIQNLQNRLDEINGQLRQSQSATDPFDPALQGVDKLQSQKTQIEEMLENFNRDLRREQLFRSRDVMNYKRQGRGGVAKKIKQWVIFANTTTQSKDKLVRSFIERPGATLFKVGVLLSPMIAAQKIMYETMSDSDKEVYDKTPSYIKNFNYVFVDDGQVTVLPKLHELALISNPIEAALNDDPLNDSMRLLAKEATPFQLGNIAQGLVPDVEGNTLFNNAPMTGNMMGVSAPSTVLTPFLDTMVNDKTGFNRKPISYNQDSANEWTQDVFKGVTGDNPNADRVQYLIQQLLGDYGKYGSYAADYLVDPSNQDKLDDMLRYLNPAQDRYYSPNSKFFREPIQEELKVK
jgi:hypothetical protein